MDITYYKKYEPVFNEWKIVREIGAGSFGKVFELERVDDFNGDIYKAALKAITIPQNESEIDSIMDSGMDEESVTAYFHGVVDEFIEEFKLMSKLEGESNIVSYKGHRVFPHENKVGWDILIQMELLTPLLKHTKEHPLGREDVISLGIDMCKALELCRRHNIIHRDIKPENIFISNNGQYKLGDFGIAKTVEKTTGGLSKKGTYTYMAPEVYKGEKYGPSVDIYSLGIVLYRYLNNNRAPFLPPPPAMVKHTDTNAALERRIVFGEEIPAPANADKALADIILKACAYKSCDRYASATEMREDLEAIAAGLAPLHAVCSDDSEATVAESCDPTVSITDSPAVIGAAVLPKDNRDISEDETVKESSEEDDSTVRMSGIVPPPAVIKKEAPVKKAPVKTPPEKKAQVAKAPEKKRKKGAAIVAAVLLVAIVSGIFLLGGPGYQEDWTEWSEKLPRGLDEDDYIIEEQLMYRSRDKQVKEAADKTDMDGWTYDGTADSGEYGAWSEWSTEKPADAEGREIETETRYRTRNLETTTGSISSKSGWTLADTTYTWGSYGSWSSWSTSKPTASDSRKVESKTQYSSRSISYTTKYTEWSSWSSWQWNRRSTSDLIKEDSRTVYGYYYFRCPYCGAHQHGYGTCWTWDGGCGRATPKEVMEWHEVWSPISWNDAGLRDWHGTTKYYTYINGELVFKWGESSPSTQYRYSTRSTYQEASYGSWSSYSDSYQSSSRTKEVRTRTVYRYCDRSKVPTYHFERWGDWSDWSDNSATATSTKQVEEQTFYRYRDKLDEKVYIYYRWSDWSDWTATPIEESDENDVESQTMYRFKSR